MRCPGQDTRFWRPEDIFEVSCPQCGKKVEFFKDEVRRRCRCGHEIVNPRVGFGCASWCPYAEQCVGTLPEEAKANRNGEERESLKNRIGLEMKKYFGTDFKRVKHALKVARYAEALLKAEGGDPLVVLAAAYLHDIGIHEAEKKHGSPAGPYQEIEGPPLARAILQRLHVSPPLIDEICDIIGHHHSPRREETINFQILYEADALVNMEEENGPKDREALKQRISTIFKTATGKALAEKFILSETSATHPKGS